jgi:alkylhydroperoxidase family enzyme
MIQFTHHTHETAPENAKPWMEKGFNPNLIAVMAEAPEVLAGYKELFKRFSQTSLSPLEQHLVMMVVNVENNCDYCVPWHTFMMVGADMPAQVIEGLRNNTLLGDDKLEALRTFTRELVLQRGEVGDDRLQAFLAAGYTQQQALEVIMGVAVKVMSNYVHAIAKPELDAPPQKFAWTKPTGEAVAACSASAATSCRG